MKGWRMTKGLSLEMDEWGIKSPLIYKREGESQSEVGRTTAEGTNLALFSSVATFVDLEPEWKKSGFTEYEAYYDAPFLLIRKEMVDISSVMRVNSPPERYKEGHRRRGVRMRSPLTFLIHH